MTMRPTLLLLLPLLGGCAELEPFLPKVTFDSLQVREITWEEADVDFVFQVSNPNPVQIGLASFTYDLELEQTPFIEGDNDQGFKLAAEGSSPLVLPLDLVYENIWNTIQATRGEDVVDFRLAGKMGFDTPAGEVKLPYDEDGGFPALRTPKISFENLRVTNVSLAGVADLELDLGVDNEHASTLFFDNFDYGIDLGGDNVASGLVSTFDVEGASSGTVTLPIAVNLINVGTAVADAILEGGKVDVGLNAAVDVDTPFGIVPLSIDETGKVGVDVF